MRPESAKCISANLNALTAAICRVKDEEVRRDLASAAGTLASNLYADFYEVLPVIDGQKCWPVIREGDTWDLNGVPVPYPPEAFTR